MKKITRWSSLLTVTVLSLFSCVAVAHNAIESEHGFEEQEPFDGGVAIEELIAISHQDDLFEMLERGVIRVAVTYSRTHYFLEKGKQYGLSYEALHAFEIYLRGRFKSRLKGRSLTLLMIPVPRDKIFDYLAAGHFDMAVANLTITDDRRSHADFSAPVYRGVNEVVVAASAAPALEAIEDLAGKRVLVRKSSSYFQHLSDLNNRLKKDKKKSVQLVVADEQLETEDLIEMVNAGLVDYTIADSHIADFWAQIFPDVVVYSDLPLAENTQIAWVMRKQTPNLRFEINRFLKNHRGGTTFGNILKQRYLQDTRWAQRALAHEDRKRFEGLVTLFKRYGKEYNFDYLMLMAQAYQESHLDHNRKSHVGAIGIMQLMPTTGASMDVGDIHDLENNIHAGVKYLRFINDRYFNKPEIRPQDQLLFSFAAYNAGPARVNRLRRSAARQGFDSNIWFGHVEHMAARYIGRETVSYVANIAKYYLAYKLISEQQAIREELKAASTTEGCAIAVAC